MKVGDRVIVTGKGNNREGTSGVITGLFNTAVEVAMDYDSERLIFFNNEVVILKSPENAPEVEQGGSQGPQKFDAGKPRMDLIRPEFTLAIGDALAYGAEKYSEKRGETPNYLKGEGFHYSKIIGSLERHIAEWKSGTDIDEESGRHHLALAAANLMFLFAYGSSEKGIDDRVKL